MICKAFLFSVDPRLTNMAKISPRISIKKPLPYARLVNLTLTTATALNYLFYTRKQLVGYYTKADSYRSYKNIISAALTPLVVLTPLAALLALAVLALSINVGILCATFFLLLWVNSYSLIRFEL